MQVLIRDLTSSKQWLIELCFLLYSQYFIIVQITVMIKKKEKKTGIELYISLIFCSMNQIIFLVLLKNYSLFISYAASFIKCEIILKIFQTAIQ